MTLKELLAQADEISLGRVLYVSVNGEEALPVRSVVLDDGRLILSNEEEQPYGAALQKRGNFV